MKKIIFSELTVITLLLLWLGIIACNESGPTDKESPMSFSKTIESTAKPVRDTLKTGSGDIATIRDTYRKTVTVSYDSVVFVESYVTTKPVDTVVVPPSTSYGTLIYSTGYDKLSDIINSSNQQGNGGLSTTIYKDGPGSFESIVKAGVSNGIRSEVQYSSSLTPTEGVIEWDVMYKKRFNNSGHSIQFHPGTPGGSAGPGLWHENGKWVWVNWKGGTNTKYPTNFTIPENQWMHCVFEYKKGGKGVGYMKFTVDGKVLLNVNGVEVGDGSTFYLKVGVNLWVEQESVAYYDNLRIYKK